MATGSIMSIQMAVVMGSGYLTSNSAGPSNTILQTLRLLMRTWTAPMATLLIIVLAFAGTVSAKDAKVGIIISDRILNEYTEAQDAQQILEEEITEWQRQATEMEEELQALDTELSEGSMFYSEEKKAEVEKKFQNKMLEYREFQANIERKAMQRNQELFAPINDKIQQVIDKIAQEDGYDIILDAVGTAIAYADPELDITDIILEELKKTE
ncbi:MAG TPA: OmpH family outer membrane protein [Bacteroidetes bacterium]|nr:OmpH family outer membrane protein [Bacteroidota bacterium]HEX05108.1 OmpH family outer membrane protein [Bacteroidota bacterium]